MLDMLENKGDRKSITRYYTYVRSDLVTWYFHKHKDISYYSAEVKYRTIGITTHEMIWLQSFL